jgi:multimeric flavodoxin WrbA
LLRPDKVDMGLGKQLSQGSFNSITVLMRLLILDGSAQEDAVAQSICGYVLDEVAKTRLPFDHIELRSKLLYPCNGCFDCWIKTPGICSIDDTGKEIGHLWLSSDVVVLLSRITYGGHGSLITRALERQIGLAIPYLITKKDDIRHGARYAHYPSLLSIGICEELCQSEIKTFKELVRQEGKNLNAFHARSLVLCTAENTETMHQMINSSLMEMKVR